MKVADNEPTVIDGFILNMTKGIYRDALKGWVRSTAELATAPPLTVPAGTFAGTTHTRSKMSILGKEVESDCWLSSVVPITGIVKSVSTEGYSQILLDFGTTGARPSF
jgi:hypothetical protein